MVVGDKGKWTIHNIPGVREEKTPKVHPHSQPLELQKMLIEATTQEGDWVLDPASVGYTVLTACQELKRNFIGCDIEFGEYFLYGSDGAMSIYGKSYGGGMCGSEDVIPMTEKEVKVWAEAHLTADEYMELFEIFNHFVIAVDNTDSV